MIDTSTTWNLKCEEETSNQTKKVYEKTDRETHHACLLLSKTRSTSPQHKLQMEQNFAQKVSVKSELENNLKELTKFWYPLGFPKQNHEETPLKTGSTTKRKPKIVFHTNEHEREKVQQTITPTERKARKFSCKKNRTKNNRSLSWKKSIE